MCVYQEADDAQLEAVHLALEAEDLMGKLDFLRVGYDEVKMRFPFIGFLVKIIKKRVHTDSSPQETKELESQIQNETVIIRDDSKRSLDMDGIVESVETQYADMAARTKEEAEHWNQKKVRRTQKYSTFEVFQVVFFVKICPSIFLQMDVMVLKAGQREQEVRDIRREISDNHRLIQRLNADLEALKRKVSLSSRSPVLHPNNL